MSYVLTKIVLNTNVIDKIDSAMRNFKTLGGTQSQHASLSCFIILEASSNYHW